MTEELILMHENTQYFNLFSFFETFKGGSPPFHPCGAAPVKSTYCKFYKQYAVIIVI